MNAVSPSSVLPLGRTLAGAVALLLERRRGLGHALATPLGAHLVLDAWALLAPESMEAALPVVLLLRIVIYVMLAINIHRLILIGPEAVPQFGLGPFGLRELRYLGWSCIQGLAAVMVVMLCAPLVALNEFVGLTVALVAAAWLVGRIALVLPEIALERCWDLRGIWKLGQGAGFGLALIVIGLPLLGAALIMPFAASGNLLLRTGGTAVSLLVVVWAGAALALAWQRLSGLRRPGDDPAAPASVNLAPDAARGLLELDVRGSFGVPDYGHIASGDGLVPYHGRLRGLVIRLHGNGWEASEAAWDALDTLLAHLKFVRVHHEHLRRVALLAPGDWEALAERLGKHLAHADVRVFEDEAASRAQAWAAGET